MITDAQPIFFSDQLKFRKWLEKNHDKETELIVGFYKVDSGKPSMTWSESVDQALCFGWIDAVRKSIDKESYFIRFTRRKPQSIWSAININKVETLTAQGLMQPAGLNAFDLRKEHKSRIYAHEKEAVRLSEAFEKKFRANKKAWTFFETLAPSYKKRAIHRVMDAKQGATRERRLEKLIKDSEQGIMPFDQLKWVGDTK